MLQIQGGRWGGLWLPELGAAQTQVACGCTSLGELSKGVLATVPRKVCFFCAFRRN